MPATTSQARWDGSIGDGNGTMSLGSGAWSGAYSVPSRFENGEGTNPEELVAAAHAGCFSMFLAGQLTRNGTPPTSVDTKATVHIEKVGEAWEITRIDLVTEAEVPGVDEATFQEKVQVSKDGCPVSKALASVKEVTVEATLKG